MWNRILKSPLIYPALLISVLLSIAIGFILSNEFLLPLLNISLAYPVLFSLIKAANRSRALKTMFFWALCLGVAMVIACMLFPEKAAVSVIKGKSYAEEMFHWIRTGQGPEGNPKQFIPVHLFHLVIFAVLSLVSASLISLLMGAILMNYMSFYVATLINASNDKVLAALMGWHPWAIIRVISFVILGIILGEPLIHKISGRAIHFRETLPLLWIALTGILLDIVMKTVLAPWWGSTLRSLLS